MNTSIISRLSITLLVLVAGLFISSCKQPEEESPEGPDQESIDIRPEVVFTTVTNEPLQFFIESRGIAEPVRRSKIVARISGVVEEHQIEEGNYVTEGDTLLQFADDEWAYELEQAHNTYLKTKYEYETQVRLREGLNFATTEEYDKLTRINTGFSDAEVAYDKAKLNYSYTSITAPFSGIISLREIVVNNNFISEGSYISGGQQLGTLIDASTVKIRFEVLESELIQMEAGMPVDLTDPSGNEYEGEIVAISPEIDPETKTGQVLIEVDNPEGTIKTGMTLEGRVFVRSVESKVKMPREALLERDGRTLVFRLNNSEVEWIYVTPVEMNTDWVLIDHPDINPGDTLAVDQHFSISHQQKVVPLMAE